MFAFEVLGVHWRQLIKCGSSQSSFSESGEIFTWGKGKAGRLGHGDTRDR